MHEVSLSEQIPVLAAGSGGMAVSIMLIAALAIGSQWLAWRIRMPSILLLLAAGFAVGPGWAWLLGGGEGLLDPDAVFGDLLLPLVGVSVGLILYEGGLTLRFGEVRNVARSVAMLVTVGAVVTWGLSALAAWLVLGLPVPLAVLLGAVLIVTGPTVIGPLLSHIRPAGQVGPTLKWEGIVIDPIGALAAVLTLEVILIGSAQEATGSVALALFNTIVFGGGIGLLAAGVMVVLLERFLVPEALQNPVSLALLICAFTLSNMLQAESGLLAATVMGIALANQTRVDTRHILEFKENLRVLIIGTLFVVLGARVSIESLAEVGFGPFLVFLVIMIAVVRPVSVLVSTIGGRLTWPERLMVSAMAPRGIVAAAVSSVFALALEQAVANGSIELESPGRLVSLTFLVIVGTVLFYGFVAPVVADVLNISDKDPQGVVIIGASRLPRVMASALAKHGVRVLLVDTNRSNVTAARLEGLEAVYGNVLEDATVDDLDLRGVGRAVALTPNAEVNTLALQRFERMLGRASVYRIPVRRSKTKSKPAATAKDAAPAGEVQAEHGRRLFSESVDLTVLERRLAEGWVLRSTTLTAAFDFNAYQMLYGLGATIMFVVNAEGNVRLVTAERPAQPTAGDTVISLVDPDQLIMALPETGGTGGTGGESPPAAT